MCLIDIVMVDKWKWCKTTQVKYVRYLFRVDVVVRLILRLDTHRQEVTFLRVFDTCNGNNRDFSPHPKAGKWWGEAGEGRSRFFAIQLPDNRTSNFCLKINLLYNLFLNFGGTWRSYETHSKLFSPRKLILKLFSQKFLGPEWRLKELL